MKMVRPARRIIIREMETAMLSLVLLPFVFAFAGLEDGLPELWRLICGGVASVSCLLCGWQLVRRPVLSKILGFVVVAGCYAAGYPYFFHHPAVALLISVLLISLLFSLTEYQAHQTPSRGIDRLELFRHRAWWFTALVPFTVVTCYFMEVPRDFFAVPLVTVTLLVSQAQAAYYLWKTKKWFLFAIPIATVLGLVSYHFLEIPINLMVMAILISGLELLILSDKEPGFETDESLWDLLINHPARVLVTTFAILCFVGTLLLLLPTSTVNGSIELVDAVFTAVSAVCVTGLIVLDTPVDFTFSGQLIILILIQLGGLGIMSITTVALHTLGRRISLKQERLMTSMTDTNHQDLVQSLGLVLKFTFIIEVIGALLLVLNFMALGDSFQQAIWRGIFTAISAFCNAGFALQSDSLIPYQSSTGVLSIISLLIILGGTAPATCLMIPNWVRGKKTPIPARIALATTVVLLFFGTVFIAAFEWNGILSGLSLWDKLQNSWFQSVTLRTAGFNSVPLSDIANPTLIVMLAMMFIGGSPGGTAGGVKTTTVGIVALMFWANIRNRQDVVTQNMRISPGTIYRAITIIVSGLIVLFLVMLMLELTQQLPARDLIFEATSAIGTVGLSTGITAQFDQIGKIIIIIAMFAGRIGPMTLFMIISEDKNPPSQRLLETRISLT